MNLGAGPKQWFKRVCLHTKALSLMGRFTRPCAVILRYHSIQKHPERYANLIGASTIHAARVFERQMELVARRFNPVTLQDILLFLKGEEHLPRRAVAVTFDDGYADNFWMAAPILRRFGIRAAFYPMVDLVGTRSVPWFCRLRYAFATTQRAVWSDLEGGRAWKLAGLHERNSALNRAADLCAPLPDEDRQEAVKKIERDLVTETVLPDDPLIMDWDQLRELQRAGHIIGSHTLTHPNLAHVANDGLIREELVESKRRLEAELARPVIHFSYPHPALDPQWTGRTVAITKEAGYETAATTTCGPVRAGDSPLSLARFWVPRLEHEFLWNLECTFLGYPV